MEMANTKSASYMAGAEETLNALGLEKDAGVRDAMRTLLTGHVPLRHGTSPARAAQIRATGLRPDAMPGVSGAVSSELADAQRGLAFATRNPATAKTYARQQQGLDAFDSGGAELIAKQRGKARKMLDVAEKGLGYLPEGPVRAGALEGLKPLRTQVLEGEVNRLAAGRALAPRKPAKGSIVEMRVPRDYVAANSAHSVEGRKMYDTLHSGMEQAIAQKYPTLDPSIVRELAAAPAALPFAQDEILRGGVPTKYIKGSPDYQGVTLDGLKQHFAAARQDPRGLAKDVARSFTGVSHRPTNILGLNRPAAAAPAASMDAFGTVPHGWRPGQ